MSCDETWGRLVVPNGNASEAVHRWFHFKESFSSELLETVLPELRLRRPKLRLLDPYVGVATSLVSAVRVRRADGGPRFEHVRGIERNPFLYLVASTKVRSFTDPRPDLRSFVEEVHRKYSHKKTHAAPRPQLSTFANADYFPPAPLRELLRLKTAVETAPGDELSRDIARVCLAACLEPMSNLRRDGRALRYEPRPSRPAVLDEFARRIEMAACDLDSVPTFEGRAGVALGDGRRPEQHAATDDRFDLALFSPPYPNNIDYTEVYKLENWFLDLIGSEDEFRAQRLRTVRSHPSVFFDDNYPLSRNGYAEDIERLLGPLIRAIPTDQYRHQRRRLVAGYFEDMLRTLKGVYGLLREGGCAVYVVGNSAHGHGETGFVVASDIIMASLAELVGFTVESLRVARFPRRRRLPSENAPTEFLRESVVILRR